MAAFSALSPLCPRKWLLFCRTSPHFSGPGLQKLDNGNPCSACPVVTAFTSSSFLPVSFSAFMSCAHHCGSAVLIVMKYGNVAAFLQFPLDFKTAGRRNILRLTPPKLPAIRLTVLRSRSSLLRTQRKRIHIAELLEQGAFSLHNRHSRLRIWNIPKTKHCGAVGHHCHHIGGVYICRKGQHPLLFSDRAPLRPECTHMKAPVGCVPLPG